MKTRMHLRALGLVLLVVLSGLSTARAYYDPGVQRWINRDPVQDTAFQNRTLTHPRRERHRENSFCFINNGPVNYRDHWGLIVFNGCSQDEKNRISKALKDSCSNAKSCALKCPSRGPNHGAGAICDYSKDFSITCEDNDSEECADTPGRRGPCGHTLDSDKDPGSITLCRRAFDKSKCDGLECTLFHEALHNPGGMSGNPHTQEQADFDKCMGCSVNYRVGK